MSMSLANNDRKRNYGLDLLRLVLMFMVCMLHTLGQGGILEGLEYGSNEFKIYWFLEILSYCAVDAFALISGYNATNKVRNYAKLVEMWFQVVFYSCILTIILTIIGINDKLGIIDIIKGLFPVTFVNYWYFTAFVGLSFVTPLLNNSLFSIRDDTAKKSIVIIFILFSILGTLTDPFKTNAGYSTLWLIILYVLGVLIRRTQLFQKTNRMKLIIYWAICLIITWICKVFLDIGRLINYLSPTILLSGIIIVILFSRMNLNGKIISKLSPLAFGIYLFQINQVVWNKVLHNAFVVVLKQPLLIGAALTFGCALMIFVSGLSVEFVRRKLAKLLRIKNISEWIVKKTNILLNKVVLLIDYFS